MAKKSVRAGSQNNRPKLLAPAGDWISLRAALASGADEIYFGIKGLNMRANAGNFTVADMEKISRLCHGSGVKAYLAINTIIYNHEIDLVRKIVLSAKKAGIDAVIAWDMSVVDACERSGLPVHLSTQVSISNYDSLKRYKKMIKNLERVVLARECSLDDIKEIIAGIRRDKLGVEIETFVHGAMCVSVSGRCFMSQEVFGKSANRGECLQPCRRNYEVYEIKDPEELHSFHIGDDYVMSPKDLCTLPFIEQLIDAGIGAFKIEGRNRSAEYVKEVVSTYREVIDHYILNKESIKDKKNENAIKEFSALKEKRLIGMKRVYNRDFSSGFYMGKPVGEWCKAYGSKATASKEYAGKVLNYYPKAGVAEVLLESMGLDVGDEIMIQGPTTGVLSQKAAELQIDGVFVKSVPNRKRVGLKVDGKVRKNDKVYRIVLK